MFRLRERWSDVRKKAKMEGLRDGGIAGGIEDRGMDGGTLGWRERWRNGGKVISIMEEGRDGAI